MTCRKQRYWSETYQHPSGCRSSNKQTDKQPRDRALSVSLQSASFHETPKFVLPTLKSAQMVPSYSLAYSSELPVRRWISHRYFNRVWLQLLSLFYSNIYDFFPAASNVLYLPFPFQHSSSLFHFLSYSVGLTVFLVCLRIDPRDESPRTLTITTATAAFLVVPKIASRRWSFDGRWEKSLHRFHSKG